MVEDGFNSFCISSCGNEYFGLQPAPLHTVQPKNSRNGLNRFQCISMGNADSIYNHFDLGPSSGTDYGRKSRHRCVLNIHLQKLHH